MYERRMRYFNFRATGMTQEQIDAEDRAAIARWRANEERWRREPSPPMPSLGPVIQEAKARPRAWDAMGLSREEQTGLIQMFGFRDTRHSGPSGVISQRRASPSQQTKDTPRKTRGGRIRKNTAQNKNVVSRGARSRSARIPAKVPTMNSGPRRPKRASNVVEELPE